MATAAAYFSGSTIMPSQSQYAGTAPDNSAAAPSTAKSRDPRFSGCIPVTIRHLARSLAATAAAGGGDAVISIDGVEATNVSTPRALKSPYLRIRAVSRKPILLWEIPKSCLCQVRVLGRVASVVNKETSVTFILDDGTGKIDLVRWLSDQGDALEAAFVQHGAYLKVQVTLVGFLTKEQGLARSIRPVADFNEVPLHFIECIHVHLENVRPKGQPSLSVKTNASIHEMPGQLPNTVQTNAPAYVPVSGGMRDHQVHLSQVNQGRFPMSVQTNASTHVPFSGGMRDHQVHLSQVNQGRLPMSVQTNASTHVPFSGGVSEQQIHYTPEPNQFSTYQGTGGQQHDLQRMILEFMQQPDIHARKNGVHADELARRFGVPTAQVIATARELEEMAFLYSTIDEFHFRSLLNN
ncbi:hypothetical protein EJB05_42061 [Eragrostis curvula]|uniref:Replication protein A C-terminal domain-containing protein n=1 Tax=Eragrostis curvula TaxID=38414 RepID=A0A5J9TB55_9POAL|nr:hypothetical protein EJB05_42061 [Eragrostis curvula]